MPEINDQIDSSATLESSQFTNVKSADYKSVYSNQTAFGSTAFDFTMTFGEIVDVDAEGKHIKVEQHVRVTMSPLHFKIFAAVCSQNVNGYEQRFGEIHLPLGGGANVVDSSGKAQEVPGD